jgi:hypothetical protein
VVGDAHVHDVGRAQVHLGRAAGPLDDDQVVGGAQPRQRRGHDLPEGQLARVVVARRKRAIRPPEQHQLRARLRLRLEQDRVHVHRRLDARGGGLHRCGAANLKAIRRDGGVERHVLGLERRDAVALLIEDAAERGHEQALADG